MREFWEDGDLVFDIYTKLFGFLIIQLGGRKDARVS